MSLAEFEDPAPRLMAAQNGVLTTAQTLGMFTRAHLRAQLAARRWQQPTRGVIVTHNGPLTDSQHAWVALLSCREGSAIGGLSALAFEGFEGFDLRPGRVHVVLPEGALRPRNPLVIPHWSTVLGAEDVHPLKLPRRTRQQRSLVDEAAWSPPPRRARAVILAGVQQASPAPATCEMRWPVGAPAGTEP